MISHTGMVYFGTEAKTYRESEIVKDSIVESVVKQFKERSEVGIAKYGVTLDREDLSTLEWLQHLQEELFDASLYIEKLKSKLHIVDIMKADEDLGLYDEELEKRMNIIGQNGNDGEHYSI
jgi:hypothetical protein